MLLEPSLRDWEVHDPAARVTEWRSRTALRVEKGVVLLSQDPRLSQGLELSHDPGLTAFTLEADVALEGESGYVGLVFGATDPANYELVYVYRGEGQAGWIQYDPVMNGSNTWQIYNGPRYQSSGVVVPPGEWVHLALRVEPDRAAITAGDAREPQLVVNPLMLGARGKVGVWGYCPGYVSNLVIRSSGPVGRSPGAEPSSQPFLPTTQLPVGLVTHWQVADCADGPWIEAAVEENGILNFNRHFAMRGPNPVAYARAEVHAERACLADVSLGFSDRVRLLVNGAEVYQSEWRWGPPETDGRIRPNHTTLKVPLRPGANTILAEVAATELPFGWGLVLSVNGE